MMTFRQVLDFIDVTVEVTNHAQRRMEERNIPLIDVQAMISDACDGLLDCKNGEEVTIVSKHCLIGVSYSYDTYGNYLTVTTVVNDNKPAHKNERVIRVK